MEPWKAKELEQLRKENAWLNDLSQFMQIMDSHPMYLLFVAMIMVICGGVGVLIGVLL
jgi:uncharacterized membrane protein YphA (DoxX/SURF4 family)